MRLVLFYGLANNLKHENIKCEIDYMIQEQFETQISIIYIKPMSNIQCFQLNMCSV